MTYQQMFHAALDGMLITGPDWVAIDANDAAARLLGIEREGIIGRRIDHLLDAGLRHRIEDRWDSDDVRRDGPPAGRFTLRRPDGGERVVQISATAADADGCRMTILRDITERHRMAAALQESEATLQAVLDASPAMIAVLDHTGAVLSVNEAWQRFVRETGCGDPAGRPAAGLPWAVAPWTGPDAAEIRATAAVIAEVLAGERESCEATYSCTGGTRRRWLRMLVRRVAGGSRAVVMHIDLTDRMSAEAALRDATEEARRAAAAKTRFLAAASHDLRQPLQAAMVYHALLAQQDGDRRTSDIVARLGRSFEAQREILDRLLDLSRIEAGIVTVAAGEFPIRAVLDRLAGAFAPAAQLNGLAFRRVDSSVRVHGDPHLIERILHNLLANAVEFTERGAILLGCRRGAGSLRVQVIDTGIGIPSAEMEAIFEEFYQIANPERDRRKGLGLGLAIADRLARLLGHRLTVRSVPGRGTLFELELPLAAARADGAAAARERDGDAGAGADGGAGAVADGGALVVVIDDDPIVLEALRMSIEAAGHRVVAGQGAEEVLRRLPTQGGAPQAIVADWQLGRGATGGDAIRALCGRFGAAIPSILLTGDTSPDRLRQAKEGGFHLLHKPVHAEQLVQTLSRLMAAGPSPDRGTGSSAAGPWTRSPALGVVGGRGRA